MYSKLKKQVGPKSKSLQQFAAHQLSDRQLRHIKGGNGGSGDGDDPNKIIGSEDIIIA